MRKETLIASSYSSRGCQGLKVLGSIMAISLDKEVVQDSKQTAKRCDRLVLGITVQV
jgi:hypothetical protein